MMTNSLEGTINQTLQIVVRCLLWLLTQITSYLMHINGTSGISGPNGGYGVRPMLVDIGDDDGQQKPSRNNCHQTTQTDDIAKNDNSTNTTTTTTSTTSIMESHHHEMVCKVSIMHHIHYLIDGIKSRQRDRDHHNSVVHYFLSWDSY